MGMTRLRGRELEEAVGWRSWRGRADATGAGGRDGWSC